MFDLNINRYRSTSDRFFVNTRTLVVIIHPNTFECTTIFSGITCILRCSMLT